MFKQEYIDRMNAELVSLQRETKSLWESGSEDEILFQIELRRKTYLFMKERSIEVAKERNLKRLKEYGDAQAKPKRSLLESKKTPKKQTKDEKLQSSLASLGLNPSDFVKRLKKK